LKAQALTLKNSNLLPLYLNHDQEKKEKEKKKPDFFPTISVSTLFGLPNLFSDIFVNKALLYGVFVRNHIYIYIIGESVKEEPIIATNGA
jgi:hypothetical protein